ncbi:S9 family peptidase [Microbacterium album]|uniref:Acyl-peptide hydrolase n=1 Tax=Microbacterium album TaxID=2053191 RepID=A0A917MM88_9MICO|nr:S9 family peptidase [Microbacterium album]GGH45607.1 peptidase S9 [Microbacterium album]
MTDMTDTTDTTADIPATRDGAEPTDAVALGDALAEAWGSWGPTMTPDAGRVAFISDRSGRPELWVQDVDPDRPPAPARRIPLTEDPVVAVQWSADASWLSVAIATDGGVRTQVWVVRPDGSDARRISGPPSVHAELGPWTRSGHHVVVTFPGEEPEEPTRSFLVNPVTGESRLLAVGDLVHVLDLSLEERLVVLLDGRRGQQFCVVVDRLSDESHPLLPGESTGSTDVALLRRAPDDVPAPLVAYVVTDVGLPRRQLVSMPLHVEGWRGQKRVLAAREDAELEALDADDAGRLLLLVWNVAGRSELELLVTSTGERIPVPELPGAVAATPVLSRDGHAVILAVEGPAQPRSLWHLDTGTRRWSRISESPRLPTQELIEPTLETFTASDGLELTGWLYRARGGDEGPGPAMLSLHGGPEAQERPVFHPQHQALAAAGITVFAPNIRGSSGFGRAFVQADDVGRRYDAFRDVLDARRHLVEAGIADADRIAVTGRSYGGYLTFASLAFSPGEFAAGVAICGMSDMLTFYRDTEPWIASAAYSKYGHPVSDRPLLKDISPLRAADRIEVPLLVVHGELDTNVPLGESLQMVEALRERDRPVDLLLLEGEGHEFRRAESRRTLVEHMIRFLREALGVPVPRGEA